MSIFGESRPSFPGWNGYTVFQIPGKGIGPGIGEIGPGEFGAETAEFSPDGTVK
jgi:hypothetical protein